jgi:hypothetical protein
MKPRSLIRSKLTLSATRRGRPVRGIRSHGTSVPRRRRSGPMQIPRMIGWARLHPLLGDAEQICRRNCERLLNRY